MPSHIFTRVGYWKESIGSNMESARAAKAGNEGHDQLHAMDYLVYAYLQTGQDAKAQAAIEEMRGITGFTDVHRRALCAGRESGALCRGARRLGLCRTASGATHTAEPCRSHDPLCAGFRRRAAG